MNLSQDVSGVGGNTNPQPRSNNRSRKWCFTSFDTNKYSLSIFKSLFGDKNYEYIVGLEKCPTTLREHYQGFVKSKNQVRFTTIKALLPAGSHIEIAHGTTEENWKYCSKENNFITNIKIKIKVGPLITPMDFDFNKWQKQVIALIDGNRDSRTINWIYDKTGNQGKTWLCKYILDTYLNCFYFRGGKANDITSQILLQENYNPEICLFDLPRSAEGKVSYNALEQLKDGIVHSNKYEGGFKVFEHPHIFVFANFEPDLECLSSDRWNLITV